MNGLEWQNTIDRALLAEFGPSVAGWLWSRGEGGGGGPVTCYCCGPHSLGRDATQDIDTVVGAVADWQRWLEGLATEFAQIDDRSPGLEPADRASRAASHLLPQILERTGAEDAWYRTFEVVLAWYLEHALGDAALAVSIARTTIDGRFESWIEPSEELRQSVTLDAGTVTARALDEPAAEALDAWLVLRRKTRWDQNRRHDHEVTGRDGHEQYISQRDAPRSAERATRMTEALRKVRAAARAKRDLDWPLLAELQAVVLGRPAEFRNGPAFGHGGAERYAWFNGIEERFAVVLAEANDTSLAPHVRAARVYLDVCYFHPFPDGNARAARLALDHVLTASGLALVSAEPVFLVARRALEENAVYSLMYVVDYVAGRLANA